jgi:hypothetical protein
MTYGLDIVLLVGRLRLRGHQTVDEIHQEVLKRRELLGVKISWREILSLFEEYCTLLRAASSVKDDRDWLEEAKKNGGMIVSVDGIQPDKGNETISLVRDALTGRVLAAENVTSSETAMRKALLAPVAALDIPVLGTITDAEQLSVLDDYALGTLTALNRDGSSPFDFAAVQAVEDLDEIADSLQRLEKKGQR